MNPYASARQQPNSVQGTTISRPAPARKIPKEHWELHREFIETTYPTKGMTAGNIIAMLDARGLKVTERQFKRKVQDWKLDKNVKGEEMKQMIRKQQRRQLEENKSTHFRVRGQNVPQAKIDRYLQDHGVIGTSEDIEMSYHSPAPTVTTLPGISYGTASERDPFSPRAPYVEFSSPLPMSGTPGPVDMVTTPFQVPGLQMHPLPHDGMEKFGSLWEPRVYSSLWESPSIHPQQAQMSIQEAVPATIKPRYLQKEEETYRQMLQSLQISHGMEHKDTLECLIQLGNILIDQGRSNATEELLAPQAFRSGVNDPEFLSLRIHTVLAKSMINQGKCFRSLEISKGRFDEASSVPIRSVFQLEAIYIYASLLIGCGEFDAGERLLIGNINLGGDFLPPHHTIMLNTFRRLASTQVARGNYQEAEKIIREVALSTYSLLRPDDLQTLQSLYILGEILFYQAKLEEAREILSDVLSKYQRFFGPAHLDTILCQITLGALRARVYGDLQMLQGAYSQALKYFPRTHPVSHFARNHLVASMYELERLTEAAIVLEETLSDVEVVKIMGPGAKLDAEYLLGSVYHKQGKLEKAISFLESALALCTRMFGREHQQSKQIQSQLAECQEKLGA